MIRGIIYGKWHITALRVYYPYMNSFRYLLLIIGIILLLISLVLRKLERKSKK